MPNIERIKQLEKEREELLKKIEHHETTVDLGDQTGAAEDVEADQAEEYANNLAVIQGFKDRLAEIDVELSKLLTEK